MQFRHSSQRDDRRRRLLNEGVVAGGHAPAAASPAKSSPAARPQPRTGPRYTEAANMEQQARVTDLIPKRWSTIAVLFLLGGGAIAGLEWLYAWMPTVASMTTDGRVAAFDLDGEGSLAAWLSSTMLALAGLVALLIYTLRRHRLDDYRGRYRVWLWAAACWLIMSIDESASLHEGFKEMMAHLTGQRLLGDGSMWWVLAYGVVLGLVGIWLLLEMRECWYATAAMMLAAGSYAVAVAAQLEFLLPHRGARGVMLEEGSEMAGNLLLLLGMVLHARYTIRDIEGLNAAANRKAEQRRLHKAEKKAKKQAAAAQRGEEKRKAAERQQRSRPAPQQPAAAQRRDAGPATQQSSTSKRTDLGSDDGNDGRPRRLSKSERRRLRKEKRARERQRG